MNKPTRSGKWWATMPLAVLTTAFGTAAAIAPGASAADGSWPTPPNVAVTHDLTTSNIETYVAVNPRDPRNLLATARVRTPDNPELGYIGTYASFDGGATWHDNGVLPQPAGFDFTADSTVQFTADGVGLVVAEGQVNGHVNSGPGGVFVWRTTDGGRSFSAPQTITPPGMPTDHTWVAVAPRGSGDHDAYVIWNSDSHVEFTRSTDDGMTFAPPRAVITAPSGLRAFATVASAGPDGHVNLSYSFASPSSSVTAGAPGTYTRYVLTSQDAGLTFGQPAPTAAAPALFHLPDGLAQTNMQNIATDPATGAVFLTMAEPRPDGKGTDIELWQSRDRGRTWAGPQQVNTVSADQIYDIQPQIALTSDGKPMISYFEVNAGQAVEVLARPAADGGFTSQTLSTASFDPMLSKLTLPDPDFPSVVTIGDFQGLAVSRNRVYAVWNDTRDGGQAQVYFAATTVDGGPSAHRGASAGQHHG